MFSGSRRFCHPEGAVFCIVLLHPLPGGLPRCQLCLIDFFNKLIKKNCLPNKYTDF
ncbi:hypothetical protein HMPREF9371_2048 [Neisseria shayeganii 871]|uniref:Uncharacterized protein n=1 Tax=Neisseria shayeganii 871 TaxID=1032488 RepID=G4CKA8_9NEIS|nr:hypothetical protein HMPREF9371_2048 [Neisseria shayeganii 871]